MLLWVRDVRVAYSYPNSMDTRVFLVNALINLLPHDFGVFPILSGLRAVHALSTLQLHVT